MKKTEFKPTQEMILAAQSLLMAMAWTATVRPIVNGYQKKILDILQPVDRYNGTVITDVSKAWHMNDQDAEMFYRDCKEEIAKAGLTIKHPDNCPLLEAESNVNKAQHVLVEATYPLHKLTADMVFGAPKALENWKKLVELNLQLLTPYVKKKLAA